MGGDTPRLRNDRILHGVFGGVKHAGNERADTWETSGVLGFEKWTALGLFFEPSLALGRTV
jgi:hypothetical protein